MEAAQGQTDAVAEAQTRHGRGAAAVEIPIAPGLRWLLDFSPQKTRHPRQIQSIYIPLLPGAGTSRSLRFDRVLSFAPLAQGGRLI